MKFTDHYATLGVPVDATQEQIKKAYRHLARTFHPDVSKTAGAEKRFTQISAAYEELQDPVRREAHDALRQGGWKDGQEMEQAPVQRGFHRRPQMDGAEEDIFGAYVRSMFDRGGRASGRGSQRGRDVQYVIAVSLEEAFRGGERQFTIGEQVHPGVDDGVDESRTITVKIPPGVIQGTRIRLRGQGGPGSQPNMGGDLMLIVELAPHPRYQVHGADVILDVPITPWEAALGARIEVPTLGGTVTATIPPDAQGGQRLRLKGRGLPADSVGDQYLALQIVVPPAATEEAKVAYRSLAQHSTFNPRPQFAP